jgi:hypothetical protein
VFYGRAYDRKKNTLDHVRYVWNFGDGATAEGPTVVHHFVYPGTYVTVLSVAEDVFSVSDYVKVTAVPAEVSFVARPDGGVTITNHSADDIDVSSWIIASFMRTFTLPLRSLILAHGSLSIASDTLGFRAGTESVLQYPNGTPVILMGNASDTHSVSVTSSEPIGKNAESLLVETHEELPAKVYQPVHHAIPETKGSDADPDTGEDEVSSSSTSSAQLVQTAAVAGASSWPWYVGVCAFAVIVGIGGVVLMKQRANTDEI